MTSSPAVQVLQAESVRVRYRHQAIFGRRADAVDSVAGVSITATRGEITGLVGESGSGKSSLGLAIAGLNASKIEGDVYFGDSTGTRIAPSRADIQMVFQDPVAALDPRQTIRAGLTELRRLYPGRSDHDSIEVTVENVGLTTNLLDRYPHQLSGGQCQRVCIARALMLGPLAIIADEPTASLDVSVQARVLALLTRLCETENVAIMLITHDIAVVRQVCEQVYVMKDGSVVESGGTERVLGDPQADYTQELLRAVPGRRFTELATRRAIHTMDA